VEPVVLIVPSKAVFAEPHMPCSGVSLLSQATEEVWFAGLDGSFDKTADCHELALLSAKTLRSLCRTMGLVGCFGLHAAT
jgi:hypothetical protein